MSRFERTISAEYFDNLYATDPDPWRFATSPYEREKYAATLAALPRPRYGRGLEIGCSIGVFSRELAARCRELSCVDVAEAALEQAKQRCRDLPHVSFSIMQVPIEWPDGQADLILLSEVVYYLDRDDVRRLAVLVDDTLVAGGDVALVHWLGETHYPLTSDEASELFIASMAGRAQVVRQQRTADYRLDILQKI